VEKDEKDQKDCKDCEDKKHAGWRVPAAWAFWGILAAVFVARLAGRSLDDFFITYRYAWNLAHGNGFVFNSGERVYGVTEPGLVFWLALWNKLTGVPVHWLGTATTAIGLVVTAGLLMLGSHSPRSHPAGSPGDPKDLGEGRVRPPRSFRLVPRPQDDRSTDLAFFLGGTLLVGSTFLWAVHGAGVFMVFALLTAAAVCAERRPGWAGLLAGAAVWFRPDAGIGLAILGLLLWRERRRFPVLFSVVAALVLAAGLFASWRYFGTAVPNTLAAKRAFAAWDPAARSSGRAFWPGAVPLLRRHLGALWLVWTAAGLAGLWPLWRRGGRAGRLLILFGGSLAVLYPLLGVPFFAWYAAPPVMALLIAIGFTADALAGLVRSERLRPIVSIVLVLLLAVPATLRSIRWLNAMARPPLEEAYRAAGLWIRDHTDPAAEVSALEVGTLAYFSERHVEDLLGLVTPDDVPYVEQRAVAKGFYNRPTEVLVVRPSLEGLLGALRKTPWFQRRYEEAARFPVGEEGDDVIILQHRTGPHVPPLR